MTVAKPCLGVNETGVSSKRQIECLDRELPVWDKIINDSYKIMMNALEPEPAGQAARDAAIMDSNPAI
jgi:hypothetical protein